MKNTMIRATFLMKGTITIGCFLRRSLKVCAGRRSGADPDRLRRLCEGEAEHQPVYKRLRLGCEGSEDLEGEIGLSNC